MEYRKIINGFNILTEESKESEQLGRKDLTITYMCDGRYFAESTYKNVSSNIVERVREKLLDNTLYNLNVEYQCQAIALPTLILQVEHIIEKGKND